MTSNFRAFVLSKASDRVLATRSETVLKQSLVPDAVGQTDVKLAIPERRYVWGIRGLDDLVLRERFKEKDGNELKYDTLFAIQDDNFNVTALVDGNINSSAEVLERFTYDPYGQFEIYDPDYRARIASKYDCHSAG